MGRFMMYNSPSEYLIAETEKFLGKDLTSEERAKVNKAIRNIGEQLSEVDRYNWKEKLPDRQGFKSQKLQNWASGILDKWKWADKARIRKKCFSSTRSQHNNMGYGREIYRNDIKKRAEFI